MEFLDRLGTIVRRSVIGAVIFIVALTFLLGKTEGTRIRSPKEAIVASYISIDDTSVKTPYHINGKKGQTFTYTSDIPTDIGDEYAMMIYSLYSETHVYVDGVEIGSYGSVKPMTVGNLIGNIRVIIPIDRSMAGHKAVITVKPFYNQHMDISAPQFAQADKLKMDVLMKNIPKLILCSILLTLFLLVLGLLLYQRISKAMIDVKLLTFFDFFIFTVVAWVICSSDLPQFVTSNNEAVSLISFLNLAMMGPAFVGYCRQVLVDWHGLVQRVYLCGWILPIVNILCFALGICDPMVLLPFTHIYYVVAIIIMLVCAIKARKKSKAARVITISILLLMIAATAGLTCFYIAPSKGYDAIVFCSGLVVFFFTLLAIIAYRIMKVVEEEKYVAKYKNLAFSDALTSLGNRTYFEHFFETIEEMKVEGKSVTLFMFDLNYLKLVNDKYGHQAGDNLLIGLADCLKRTFGDIGETYRLGGDEFAAIVIGYADQILTILDELNKNIEKSNKYRENKISTAIGYATRKYNKEDIDFYNKLFRDADDMMYANKLRCHQQDGRPSR